MAVCIGLASMMWGVVGVIVVYSTFLRPSADDYCHGAGATAGYIQSIGTWYATWIGDLFQVSVTALLVGQPLANLPFEVASAIPFLATAAAVAALIAVAVGRIRTPSRQVTVLTGAVLIPLALVVWWGYWWVPASLTEDRAATPWLLATAMLHWQTVGVQYSLVPAVLVAGYLVVRAHQIAPTWFKLVAYGGLGLLCGLGGLAFGTGALAFGGVILIAGAFATGDFRLTGEFRHIAFVVLSLAGLAISYLAPGTAGRSAALASNRPQESMTPWRLFEWLFPNGVFTWASGVAHAGTLVVALIAVGVGCGLHAFGARIDPAHLTRTAAGLLGFSLLASLASRGAEAFSYPAYWHEITARTVIFVSVVLLGLAAGSALTSRHPVWAAPAAVAAAVALLVVLGSLFLLQHEAVDRYTAWIAGPAPGTIGDTNLEWVRNCWERIADYRLVPDRGL